MTLLAVERIKLFSTRSPWWCIALAAAISIGFSALVTGLSADEFITVGNTQVGYNFAFPVVLVLAILGITTEYRFGTIKSTFMAAPNRTKVMLAKTALVAMVCGLIGEVTAFTSWGVANLIKPSVDLSLNSQPEWRYVAGIGLVYAIGAVIGISIGALVRQTAAAVSIVLVFILLVESLIGLVPKVGDDIQVLMPFINANHFLASGSGALAGEGAGLGLEMHWGPWGALAYYSAIALVFLVAAVAVVERRDA
ncbi:MAG TPA: hypothetical protein VGD67_15700 [Pseudonocardiaceae bacterium]